MRSAIFRYETTLVLFVFCIALIPHTKEAASKVHQVAPEKIRDTVDQEQGNWEETIPEGERVRREKLRRQDSISKKRVELAQSPAVSNLALSSVRLDLERQIGPLLILRNIPERLQDLIYTHLGDIKAGSPETATYQTLKRELGDAIISEISDCYYGRGAASALVRVNLMLAGSSKQTLGIERFRRFYERLSTDKPFWEIELPEMPEMTAEEYDALKLAHEYQRASMRVENLKKTLEKRAAIQD